MSDAAILVAPVAIPLVFAALATLLRHRPAAARAAGGAGIALMTLASLMLLLRATAGPVAVTVFGGWQKAFAVSFVGDVLAAVLSLTTGVIATAAAFYGVADLRRRRRCAGYDAMMLAMLAAVNGAFLTGDLFNLYVWFELALVSALGLLSIDRTRAGIDGALRYATLSMLGASFILLGIALLYGSTGTLDIARLGAVLADEPATASTAAAAALLLAGFGLKSGLVPFHFWLPASYHAAPITVSAVFAGLLTKMGFYALLRIMAGVFGIGTGGIGGAAIEPLLAGIAVLTMILCALAAMAQGDIRRVLAWQVIAQVGYMLMGLALATRGGLTAAVFYMVHSMIVQANLFLGAGAIHRATGSWRLKRMGGMMKANPAFALLFAVPALSLAGIPPFSGFWAKTGVIRAALFDESWWQAGAAFAAGLLTIISVAFIWSEALWKDPPRGHRIRAVPPAMLAGMTLLSAATLAISLAPQYLWGIAQEAAMLLGSGRAR